MALAERCDESSHSSATRSIGTTYGATTDRASKPDPEFVMNAEHMMIEGLTIAVLSLSATTLGLGVLWIRAREKLIRLQQKGDSGNDAEQRLERIEAAVETIAIESERLGEANRFIAQLLSDRSSGDAVPSHAPRVQAVRSITPH
jgi:hypothetical protein